ncbi:restriction endonuclease subunit S [Hymenobacter sp. DG25B]|uniref:restriction endonuclease subunit S n=1 Tax=Hymenobacter sp. DG25B TaxID=1385664 RepID=UPI000662C236|nr:restriction endonuclease subunit S [Hymenobacter sp. DG25B]
MQEEQELPKGWVLATFKDVGTYINGRAFKPTEWEETGRPILRIQNLTKSTTTINRYPREIEEKYIVRPGELLISWSATLGAFIYNEEEAVLNQHIFKVVPKIDKLFLYYGTLNFIGELKSKTQGSGMQHITKGNFEDTAFPVPPLPEQKRIVAKLEELFSRLDAGVAAVRQSQKLLKRYRQSVLHAAVTGALTSAWRTAHPAPRKAGRRCWPASGQSGRRSGKRPNRPSEAGSFRWMVPGKASMRSLQQLIPRSYRSCRRVGFGLQRNRYVHSLPREVLLIKTNCLQTKAKSRS